MDPKEDTDSDWDFCDVPPKGKQHAKENKGRSRTAQTLPGPTIGGLSLRANWRKPVETSTKQSASDFLTSLRGITDERERQLASENHISMAPPNLTKSLRATDEHCASVLQRIGFKAPIESLPKCIVQAASNRITSKYYEHLQKWHPRHGPHACFLAGSFMFPTALCAEVRTDLHEHVTLTCPATLRNFDLRCVSGVEWPALIEIQTPDKAAVHGMMRFHVAEELKKKKKIDLQFDPGMFRSKLAPVELELEDGSRVEHYAFVYVWKGEESRLVSKTEKIWRPDMLRGSWYWKDSGPEEEEGSKMTLPWRIGRAW